MAHLQGFSEATVGCLKIFHVKCFIVSY